MKEFCVNPLVLVMGCIFVIRPFINNNISVATIALRWQTCFGKYLTYPFFQLWNNRLHLKFWCYKFCSTKFWEVDPKTNWTQGNLATPCVLENPILIIWLFRFLEKWSDCIGTRRELADSDLPPLPHQHPCKDLEVGYLSMCGHNNDFTVTNCEKTRTYLQSVAWP
jgi:hypothetical protein